MSHRCIACDWSPTVPSAFNEQMVYPHGNRPHRLVHDPKSKETYCNSCYDAIRLTISVDNVADDGRA